MKKITILYLIDDLRNMGGAERNLINIMSHIDKNKFQYFLCTFQLSEEMEHLLNSKNIACVRSPEPTTFQGMKKFFALSKYIRYKKVDILHSYFEGSDIWGTMLAKFMGIPAIISSKRDMGFSKTGKINTAYRFINPFVTRIISVSDAVKRQVSLQEKVNERKIVTIHNGIDCKIYNNLNHKDTVKSHLRLNINSPIVGVIANIRPIKGLEYFIYAASRVIRQFPETQFIIVGKCLPGQNNQLYFDKLKSLVKNLQLENNLFFLGGRSDIPTILSIMDVSVLSSLSEGFSNTVIESMAAGKPLVVTDVGGNAEAVVHDKTGFVVPPRSADKLADSISALLADQKMAVRMGKAGRKRVEQLFSLDTMVEKIENLYTTVLNGDR